MSLRQQNKARVRSSIISAATALIAERGASCTTTREIAKLAGVSYQTLYNYFPTKALILQELLTDELDTWGLKADAVIKRYDGDVLTTLNDVNQVGLDLMLGPNREIWRELAGLIMQRELEGEQLFSKASLVHARYHALLSMAQGMGHLRKDADLHLIAHTLFCLSDYTLLQIFILEAQAEQFMDTLAQQTRLIVGPYLNAAAGT